ncbi:MAG TPA: Lrp/AsnC family transcriptional regulator [Thermoplasmata archaeon]|nr:MAG TPA: Lrp/AsnC family transcriptional regulator [Thermoplasmata archaeon]
MPKSSLARLLKDEQKIIEVLQTNGHESIDVIAKKCGFSRQKVWRIIKRLHEQKIIWGYTAICEEERYNLKHFTMLVKRTTVPIDKKITQEIISTRLDNLLPDAAIKIEHIEYTHGSFDGIFTFYAPDLITAKKFCERFHARFHLYIDSVELLEGILFLRKQMLRNPNLNKQVLYL